MRYYSQAIKDAERFACPFCGKNPTIYSYEDDDKRTVILVVKCHGYGSTYRLEREDVYSSMDAVMMVSEVISKMINDMARKAKKAEIERLSDGISSLDPIRDPFAPKKPAPKKPTPAKESFDPPKRVILLED